MVAHRGGPDFPENSLAAFSHALDIGVDGVELDVLIGADGSPIVAHDTPLESAPMLEEALQLLDGAVRRVYIHYKRQNEHASTGLTDQIKSIADRIEAANTRSTVVGMVGSGNVDRWLEVAPQLPVLQCWTGPFQ